MPQFHFNIFDGITDLDHDGTDLPDWHAAQLEAVRRAGAILKDDPKVVALGEVWRMDVTDDTGLVLFRLDFSVLRSPAVAGSSRKQAGPM